MRKESNALAHGRRNEMHTWRLARYQRSAVACGWTAFLFQIWRCGNHPCRALLQRFPKKEFFFFLAFFRYILWWELSHCFLALFWILIIDAAGNKQQRQAPYTSHNPRGQQWEYLSTQRHVEGVGISLHTGRGSPDAVLPADDWAPTLEHWDLWTDYNILKDLVYTTHTQCVSSREIFTMIYAKEQFSGYLVCSEV